MNKDKAVTTDNKLWKSPAIMGVLLAILAILLYSNTFSHEFTVDDPLVITKNEFVQEGISGISKIWTSSYLEGFNGEVDAAYRPLSLTLFAIENSFFGNQASSMHFMHVLYYGLGILLCYLFSYKLFDNRLIAIMTTLIFALHPIHTEVVNNLKSRDEILLLIGIMGMGYFYLRYLDKSKLYFLSLAIVSYLIALFSKESAVSYFLLIPLLGLAHYKKWSNTLWSSVALFFGVSLFYLAIRTMIVGGYDIEMTYMNNALVGEGDWLSRLPDALTLFGKYLLMLIVPYPLSVDYSYNSIILKGWSSVYPYVSLLVSVGLIYGSYQSIKSKHVFGVLIPWFFITIVVASNLFILIGSTFAERFLFVPSYAFCAILAYGIYRLTTKYSVYVVSVICFVFAVLTFVRNENWSDDETLFNHDVAYQQNNARVLTFHGKFAYESAKKLKGEERAQKLQTASESLARALEIAPDYMVANHYQGFVAKEMGDLELAQIAFGKVKESNPEFSAGLLQYAISLSKAGKYNEAIVEYDQVIKKGDKSFAAIYNKGYCHFKLKQYSLAEADFLQAYKIEPTNTALLSNMIKVYRDGLKNIPQAMKYNDELIQARKNKSVSK